MNIEKITVTNIDGSKTEIEFAKHLAQLIYQNTGEISELNFALELFKTGEVEPTPENLALVDSYVDAHFKAVIKLGWRDLKEGL